MQRLELTSSHSKAPTHLPSVLTVSPLSLQLSAELSDLAGLILRCFLSQSSDHPGVSRPNERCVSSVHARKWLPFPRFYSRTQDVASNCCNLWASGHRETFALFFPFWLSLQWEAASWINRNFLSCFVVSWRGHCDMGSLELLHAGA